MDPLEILPPGPNNSKYLDLPPVQLLTLYFVHCTFLIYIYEGISLSSKEVANVGVTVHAQQRLNGPHGTPVHDFLSVA